MHDQTSAGFILAFDAEGATLETVGGKGAALASMAKAGLPVPAAFYVTTTAYRRFVDANRLQVRIEQALSEGADADPATLERAAATIRTLFDGAIIPDDVAAAIIQAYGAMHEIVPAVAVRSSATAEDLPGLSFAGQLETFLNVRSGPAVLAAVRECWASLWTARAIGYRRRMGVDQTNIAIGIVVQRIVPAEVSGILFTANPATGERSEIVVNASFGLGPAIVSGQVTPDVYTVDRIHLTPKEIVIGAKEIMTTLASGQGVATEAVPAARRAERALSDAALRELAMLGLRVEEHFGGAPQDIEWALAHGRFWLLQARPITHLPAAPPAVRWRPPAPGTAWIRRQVVENMPEPLSPLFAGLYLPGLDAAVDMIYRVMHLPARIGSMIDRPFFATVHGYAYMRATFRFRWTAAPALLRMTGAAISWMFRGKGVAYWRDEALPNYLALIERWKRRNTVAMSDEQLLHGMRELAYADAAYWWSVSLAVGTAKITEDLLNRFLSFAAPSRGLTSGMYLRGLHSKTIESQAELDRIADRIRGSSVLQAAVVASPPERLADALASIPEGRAVLEGLQSYLDRFGHQIYTLDFAEPTQADNPLPVLLSLKAMAARTHPALEARLAEITRDRDAAIARTEEYFGPLRRWMFRRLLRTALRFAPYREEALFYIGAAWPTLRRMALELGGRLFEAGLIDRRDNVFFLKPNELAAAAGARTAGNGRMPLARLAGKRRRLREIRKRLHPPAAAPPDYRWKLGPFSLSGRETQIRNPANAPVLRGFAVSPGRVSAPASVILSPADFDQMTPGTILVCPTTTPAWTPLFAQALGLVTDVGGVLAHGSIVAREYGIPAVMGVGNATQRITAGQRVTVDGDAGVVTLTG